MSALSQKNWLVDVTLAAVLAASVIGAGVSGMEVYEGFRTMQAIAAPVEEWIQVKEFRVTDSQRVELTVATFAREVALDLQNHWNAAVVHTETGITYCHGEGVSNMLVNKPTTYTYYLPELIGDPTCDLPTGTYKVNVSWVLSDFHGTTKTMSLASNEFEIFPRP